MSRLLVWSLVALVGVLVAVSQLSLRHGMRQIGVQQPQLSWGTLLLALSNPWVLISLALGATTFATYACLLSRVDVTLAAPATNAVFYLVMFLVSVIWLRENVNATRVAGASLLLIAMWLLSRG